MFPRLAVALTRPAFMGGPESEAINQPAFIYAARNFSVCIALIIALALQNATVLFILILVQLISDPVNLPLFLSFDLITNVPLVASIIPFR